MDKSNRQEVSANRRQYGDEFQQGAVVVTAGDFAHRTADAGGHEGQLVAGRWVLVKGKPGARLELDGEFQAHRKQLPIVMLRRVA